MSTALTTNEPSTKGQLKIISRRELNTGASAAPVPLETATPAEVCNYIEELAKHLRGLAIQANQKFIAYLLTMAADEASAEYYRLSRSGARP